MLSIDLIFFKLVTDHLFYWWGSGCFFFQQLKLDFFLGGGGGGGGGGEKKRKHLYFIILKKCLNKLMFNFSFTKKVFLQSKKDDKDQETIQSSTTPDPGYNKEK